MSTTPTVTDQFQYVKMPDGSYGKFSASATPEEMRAAVEKSFPDAYKAPGPEKSGFFQSAYDSTVGPFVKAFTEPENEEEKGKDALGRHFDANDRTFGRGLMRIGKGMANFGKQQYHTLKDDIAYDNPGHEQPTKFAADIANTIFGGAPLRMAQQMHQGDIAGAVGTGLGTTAMFAGPKILGEGLRAAAPLMERSGLGFVNSALGATGPKPFRYGANPARGAIEEGVVSTNPFRTKHGAALRTEAALNRVGPEIAEAVQRGKPVPASDISSSIENPVFRHAGIIEGPGGGSRSLAPLLDEWSGMTKRAPNASQPIYGSRVPQNLPASDVWQTIRNIDENTRFNPDPEIEGVNELRREIRGGLRSNLEASNPEIGPRSQTFADLRGAQDALDRTMHGGTSFKKILSVPTFGPQTAIGSGLVKVARGLGRGRPTPFALAAPFAAATQHKERE